MISINSKYCIFLRNNLTFFLNIRILIIPNIIAPIITDIINPLSPNLEIMSLTLLPKKYIRKTISIIKTPFITEKAFKKERISFNLLNFFSILIFELNISILHHPYHTPVISIRD